MSKFIWENILVTKYFKEQVLNKRSYLKSKWIQEVIASPRETIIQNDGRIRLWGYIEEEKKYLRIVLLEDAKIVHNAFFDRNYQGG